MAESSTSNGVDAGVDYSTDVVIVGTGPAGGSLGAFMGSLGMILVYTISHQRLTHTQVSVA